METAFLAPALSVFGNPKKRNIIQFSHARELCEISPLNRETDFAKSGLRPTSIYNQVPEDARRHIAPCHECSRALASDLGLKSLKITRD
jgi:hypothetical protein